MIHKLVISKKADSGGRGDLNASRAANKMTMNRIKSIIDSCSRISKPLNSSGNAYTADRFNLGFSLMATRRKKTMAIVAAGANRVITNMVADSPARRTTYLGTARGYPANGSSTAMHFAVYTASRVPSRRTQ
jgi:hypothetical protein